MVRSRSKSGMDISDITVPFFAITAIVLIIYIIVSQEYIIVKGSLSEINVGIYGTVVTTLSNGSKSYINNSNRCYSQNGTNGKNFEFCRFIEALYVLQLLTIAMLAVSLVTRYKYFGIFAGILCITISAITAIKIEDHDQVKNNCDGGSCTYGASFYSNITVGVIGILLVIFCSVKH